MFYPLTGFVFVFFWLAYEISLRAKWNLKPATWKDLYVMGSKHNPDPRQKAAVFVGSVLFAVAFWESVMRFFFQRENLPIFFVCGLLMSGAALYLRKKSFETAVAQRGQFRARDLWLFVVSWTLLMGSGLSLVLAPWLWLRTRRLLH